MPLYIYPALHVRISKRNVFRLLFVPLSMGKTFSGSSWGFWMAGFGVLVPMMRKLQTTFSRSKGVKQGHFVVIATQGWKPERFFIELGYLDHPDFVKLLKQAEEEFGFSQVGALAIPCEPDDLKRIIGRKKNRNEGITCWVKGIRVA
ncbi:Auxin-responsive protein SAUR32 [Spatholobus suberectus]|nr:Auxin-responsive protein SAUR32 [Spatholobus suberectus]